jgi:hypothetical protein
MGATKTGSPKRIASEGRLDRGPDHGRRDEELSEEQLELDDQSSDCEERWPEPDDRTDHRRRRRELSERRLDHLEDKTAERRRNGHRRHRRDRRPARASER